MFRIWIYLSVKNFILSLINSDKIIERKKFIENYIKKQSNKNSVFLFSQCRIGFLFILKFLKKKNNTNKKEVIFCAYNLPEMVNIVENLKLKIRFCDIDHKTGLIDTSKINKQISKKTLAIVMTNMFNNYQDSKTIK